MPICRTSPWVLLSGQIGGPRLCCASCRPAIDEPQYSQARNLGQSRKATVIKKQPMRLGLITYGCALA